MYWMILKGIAASNDGTYSVKVRGIDHDDLSRLGKRLKKKGLDYTATTYWTDDTVIRVYDHS